MRADTAPAPTCLYAIGGYKVWLGSLATDGKRLVSDGRDNAVLVHDFSAEPAVEGLEPSS